MANPPAGVPANLFNLFLTYGAALVGTSNLPLAPANPSAFARTETYWHRVNVTSTANQLTFFNAAKSKYVSNLPQPGYIPGNHAMWLQSLAFTVETKYQVDGTAEVDGENYQADADPQTMAADLDALIMNGLVVLKIGTRTLIETYGLYHFPSGGGTVYNGVHTNSNGTTINSAAHIANGLQQASNRFWFVPPHPVYPNEQIQLTVDYPFNRTLKDNYVIKAELYGQVVSIN